MKLKNYTSTVNPEKSISEIERFLVEAGASHIAKTYKNGETVGIIFQMPIPNSGNLLFKLPAKTEAVLELFLAEMKRPHRNTRKKLTDQAGRTAWRILRDWVYAQVSMILLNQAERVEVFLPYLYDGKTDETFYRKIAAGGFKMLRAANQP